MTSEEFNELEERLEAYERDAIRYRWLKKNSILGFNTSPGWQTVVMFNTSVTNSAGLDVCIDAAMKA